MEESAYEPLRNHEEIEEQSIDVVANRRTNRIASLDVFRGLSVVVKLSSYLSLSSIPISHYIYRCPFDAFVSVLAIVFKRDVTFFCDQKLTIDMKFFLAM